MTMESRISDGENTLFRVPDVKSVIVIFKLLSRENAIISGFDFLTVLYVHYIYIYIM